MRKGVISLLLALTLALGCAPTALAVMRPTLLWSVRRDGSAVLSLEDLDGGDIYGVQLELTLSGNYPDCTFIPASRTTYSPDCTVLTVRGRTWITLYLTDLKALNDHEALDVGVLYLDGTAVPPETVRVQLLDERLRTLPVPAAVPVTVFSQEGAAPSQPSQPFQPSQPSQPSQPFQPSQPSQEEPRLPDAGIPLPFADVNERDWFYGAADYVYAGGMMRGLTEDRFAPYDVTDRAMIVTILYRLEESPAALPAEFTDVGQGQYYAGPVAWASASGVVTGYEDATFRPAAPVTREQLAAILYRYAGYKGLNVSARGDLSQFPDASMVSPYAVDAISWAVASGLINGTDGKLDPGGAASRAQVAVILQRFCANLLEMG